MSSGNAESSMEPSSSTNNVGDTSNDMRNVAGFAFGGKNIAGSTIYLHPPAPIQPNQVRQGDNPNASDYDLSHLPEGVVVHYFIDIRGPVIARDVLNSIVCGTEHSHLPGRSRPRPAHPGRGDGRPEHFFVRNIGGPAITSRVEDSVIAYVIPGQAGSGERTLYDAMDDPSINKGNPDADDEHPERNGSSGPLRDNSRYAQGAFKGRGQGPSDDVRSLRERRLRNRRCGDAAKRRQSAAKAKRRQPLKRITCTDSVSVDGAKVVVEQCAYSKSK
ncbi:hypothetical protein DFP72DRAFT_917282 [Ephemerocybe angulata]|uniref:Uncharacterized protein n=1 Tax=Ephemerocybe angulata TaxID=980116 RepID=A0A8H6HJL5_9AGAR|nr:hypothetical protein DFP72DRAFT_917282 [Tulosesus angulatus]